MNILKQESFANVAVCVLATVSVFAVLSQSRDVFAPVLAALLLGIVISPISDLFDRLRVPAPVAAFVIVGMALAMIFALIAFVEPYVSRLIARAPTIWFELREIVEQIKGFMQGLEEITEDVSEAIDGSDVPVDSVDAGEGDDALEVPSLTDALFYAPAFAAQLLTFTGTLYFFLLGRNQIYKWVGKADVRLTEEHLRYAARQVSRYFMTVAAINFVFGCIITLVMTILGMPSPILWGTLAFFLNFLLYLGPAFLGAALLVAGIVVFDGTASFLPAILYLSLNATEGQFVTPSLIGKSMSVNPLLVFLSLVFWLWLWGPIGGIIAIPLLIWLIAIGTRPDKKPTLIAT